MAFEIKIPSVGESITEATIGEWLKSDGDYVEKDEAIVVLETDKASVDLTAEKSGKLKITAEEGDTLEIGSIVGEIDESAAPPSKKAEEKSEPSNGKKSEPSNGGGNGSVEQVTPHPPQVNPAQTMSPAVRRVVDEKGIDPTSVQGSGRGGRLVKQDVLNAKASTPSQPTIAPQKTSPFTGEERRVPMTTIRRRIAERLVDAQQTAAILTTFNEIDMTNILSLRAQYKDQYKEKYGISLGFMGFFVMAVIEGLKEFPAVNAFIEGTDIVYHDYVNMGVAVSTEKGLMVPVMKGAHLMGILDIESEIRNFALKARDGKISIDDLSGGTFTISNGGVFGSLMSTPILNPPQSGILGMHKIEKRAVVIGDKVEVRPMMYVALSYDHRMIDGREAVGFLVRVKECIEDPNRLLIKI